MNARRWTKGLSVLLALILAAISALPMGGALAESDGMIRVKLTRLGAPSSIAFETTCDYYVYGHPEMRVSAGQKVTVSASDGAAVVKVGSASASFDGSVALMRSRSGNCGAKFTSPRLGNTFCGDLRFLVSGSTLTTILNIYIEDYLYGVVGYEMSPSWNAQALMAQAVVARNYALRKKSERGNQAWHVTDTTSDQVFRGRSASKSYDSVVSAVDASRGVVLTYGGALARCYYSASNGGQTESAKNAWGGSLAYSVVKDDPYDYSGNGTAKSASIAKDGSGMKAALTQTLLQGAQKALGGAEGLTLKLEAIESIAPKNPKKPAPSRLYSALTFTLRITAADASGQTRTGTVDVDVPTYGGFESWYGLSINSADNETVWVTESEKAFTVTFRRNGHGVGLSQCGAQNMAKNHGKNAAEILEFYYPGTALKKLSLTDTTADRRPEATPAPTPDVSEEKRIGSAMVGENAALYAGASAGAEKLLSIREGAVVKVYAVRDGWAAVCAEGRTGFMPLSAFSIYLPAGSAVRALPEASYARADAAAELYALALEGAAKRGKISKGEIVQVCAYTEDWAAVTTQGGLAGFVKKAKLTPVAAATPMPTASPTPTPAPASDVVTVNGEKYVYVSAASAKMYRSNSESSRRLRTLPYGTRVRLSAYNAEWAYVRVGSTKGFIRRSLLTERSPVAKSEKDVIQAEFYAQTTRRTAVYASASEKAGVKGTLKKGQRLTVYAYNSAFAYVGLGRNRGFVPLKNLKIVN